MSKETKPKTAFERGTVLIMACVCAISLLAVSGWMFNLPLLASLHPEYIPMAPSTALIFLGLSGAALIYGAHPPRRGMRILVQTGQAAMLVSVLLLVVRTFTGFGPNLEQILFPNPALLGGIETARMSPLTALGFILAIPAFHLLTRREPGRRTKSAAAALALAVFVFSGLITLSYLYGAPPFYGGTLIPLALPTAISFLFLSLGLLLAAGPTCWPVRMFVGPALKARLMRAIIPTAMAIVLLQGYLSTAGGLWFLNPAFKVAFAALVAGLIFVFIISVIAQNLSTDIERGKQAEEALQAISYRQQVLLAAVPDIIMEVDNHKVYTWANQPGQKFFGPDVVGHETAFYFAGEQEADQKVNPLFVGAENITYIENWQRRKDGEKRLLAWWCHRLEDANGNVTGILSTARDITEQRLVEIALTDERNLLVTLLDNIPDMIYFKDTRSRIVRVNNAHARRFGFDDPAQLVGKTDFDLFGDEHAQAAYDDEQEILRSGQPLVAKDEKEDFLDGHTLWVSTTKMALRDHNGQISGTFGISRDITDRKEAEKALRESEERFRSLYENVPTGIYRTSPDGHILMANPALLRMLGYETLEELSQRNLTAEGYDPEHTRQEFEARIERDGEVRGLESAWKCKDGSILYVRESARLVQGENNQPFYYEGTVEDISERKRAEEALRKSASSLQAVLHSTADGILAVGLENEVLYANDRFAEIWQIPPEVMASQEDSTLLRHVLDQLSDPQSFLKKVQELYRSNEDSFDTLDFKDGRVFERLSRPLMQGAVAIGRVWSFRDISVRKHYELVQNATYRITQSAITCDGIDTLCQSIHATLGELISAENFFIALYDSATGSINFPYFIDQYDTAPAAPAPTRGLTGYVIRTGRPLLATRESYAELVQQGEVKPAGTVAEQMIRMPLKIEGRIIGVIGVQNYRKEKHFQQGDVDLLEFVSTQVAQAIERKRLEEEIRSLSLTDELSGLYNRRGFTLLAEREVKLARRMKRSMLLFFCDVDGLKAINDSLGHAQGDQVLKDISFLLKQIFRESDIVARMGGDEFVVLAVDASQESAESMANRIQATLEERNRQRNASYQLSLSLGIAFYDPAAPRSVSELISQADGLMYEQKQARKRKAGGF